MKLTPLEITALVLGIVHFGIPLAYYWYAKTKWLRKPWNLRVREDYKPRVTIIIPTYNEAGFIAKRLDNIYEQDYPRELVEVIVVDSASTDGTPEIVEKWVEEHKDLNVILIRENSRRGMVAAINYALRMVEPSGDIVFFTDADAWWPNDALRKVVKYFADKSIGAVSASIVYDCSNKQHFENVYRSYYNDIRVAESKRHSTPVHNGPLIAFRKELLYEIGLLPEYTGNDDSTPASIIAFMGYRAIQIDEVVVKEYVRGSQFRRMVRRAQHLVAHFTKTKKWSMKKGLYKFNKDLETIWIMEWWLHVVNPWLLATSFTLLMISCTFSLLSSLVILAGLLLLVVSKVFRMWVLTQLCLLIAILKNVKSVDITWTR